MGSDFLVWVREMYANIPLQVFQSMGRERAENLSIIVE